MIFSSNLLLVYLYCILVVLASYSQLTWSFSRTHRSLYFERNIEFEQLGSLQLSFDGFDPVFHDIESVIQESAVRNNFNLNSDKISIVTNIITNDIIAELSNAILGFAASELEEGEAPMWTKLGDNTSLLNYQNRVDLNLIKKALGVAPTQPFIPGDQDSIQDYTFFFDVVVSFAEVMFNKERFYTVSHFLSKVFTNQDYREYLFLPENREILVSVFNAWFETSRARCQYFLSVALGMSLILSSQNDKSANLVHKVRLMLLQYPHLISDSDSRNAKNEMFEDILKLTNAIQSSSSNFHVNTDKFQILFPGSLNFHWAHQGTEDSKLYVALNDLFLAIAPDLSFPERKATISPSLENSLFTSDVAGASNDLSDVKKSKTIGIVSGHFYDQSVGKTLLPTLWKLDRLFKEGNDGEIRLKNNYKLKVYYLDISLSEKNYFEKKAMSAQIHQERPNDVILKHFHDIFGENFVHLPENVSLARQEIVNDNLDFLLFADIGMKISSLALALGRLAPVQAVFWGHPVTSGSSSIDYYLSLDSEVPDANMNYQEQLVRMQHVNSLPLLKFHSDLLISRESLLTQLNLNENAHYVAVLGRLFKIHPIFEDIIVSLLTEMSTINSNYFIVFIGEASFERNENLVKNIYSKLSTDIASECISRIRFADYSVYKSVVVHADAVLDTYPYGGCLTTQDAISNSVPVVTLPSHILAGKFSKTLYHEMNMLDLIADDTHSYVYLVMKLLSDSEFHATMVQKLEQSYQQYMKEDHNLMAAKDWLSFLESIFAA